MTVDMTEDGRPIEASATGQHGFFTLRQATAAGVTRAVLRSRVQSGNLVKAGVRTYTTPLVRADPLGELVALMLDVGDDVWACGPTAAALHRFDGFALRPPFHLLTRRDRAVRRVGHHIHTTTDLGRIDQGTVGSIAVTTPSRTIIDLVRSHAAARVTVALDSALRDGGTSETFMHQRISALRSSGRHGVPRLLSIIEGAEITRGGASWLERRFLEIVHAAGLPKPDTQVVLSRAKDRLVRVDCFYAEHRTVVELLGYRWHRSKLQMQGDTERMNRLMLEGLRVIQFTYDDVVERPDGVVGLLRQALDL